jgi:hypothetical protein
VRSLIVLVVVLVGLGAAFLFARFLHRMGVSLREAMARALFRNAIGPAFTPAIFIQGGMVRFRTIVHIVTAAGRVKVSKLSAEGLGLREVSRRLAAHLARRAAQERQAVHGGLAFPLAESRQKIAAQIGTVRELASRRPNFFDRQCHYTGDGQKS